MGWYRRGKLAHDGFRNWASQTAPQNSVLKRSSRICPSGYSNSGLKGTSFYRFSSFSLVSHRLGTGDVEVNQKFHNPFLAGAKRFYCMDADNVPRGLKDIFKWYFESVQTVPYTKRTRSVVMTITHERRLMERCYEEKMGEFEGKILAPTHPDNVRVKLIFKNIIDALQREVKKMGCASKLSMLHRIWMGLLRRSQPFTSHLDGLNWEVLVVNTPDNYAFCMPGGKIVVSTSFLRRFRSDAEIATTIGHEVAHIVARHHAEKLTKTLWVYMLHSMVNVFVTVDVPKRMSPIIDRLPFNRRMEMEADYIGMLLMALAGYDPQSAPKLYEKLDEFNGKDVLLFRGPLGTHPFGRKRAKALARPKIMEEALILYKKSMVERLVIYSFESFPP